MRRAVRAAAALAALALCVALAAGLRHARHMARVARGEPAAMASLAARLDAILETQRIVSAALDLEYTPDPPNLEATARLDIALEPDARAPIALLLDGALRIRSVAVNGARVAARREGPALFLPRPPGARATVLLEYGGLPGGALPASAGLLAVPALACWHPADLRSFHTVDIRVRTPRDVPVLSAAAVHEVSLSPVYRDTRLRYGNPLIAAPLAIGARRSPPAGAHAALYAATLDTPPAPGLARDAARIWSALTARLGRSAFDAPRLLLHPAAAAPVALGTGIVAVPPGYSTAPHGAFVALADALARAWWGETAAPRWFAPAGARARWIAEGLPRYEALECLRRERGRAAWLAHLEQTLPGDWPPPGPEDEHPAAPWNAGRDAAGGAAAARLIAERIGHDAFARACAETLRTHAHAAIAADPLLDACGAAAGRPVAADAAPWLEPGALGDFALGPVVDAAGQVQLRIERLGAHDAPAPLELAIVTARGVRIETVTPGTIGARLEFDLDAPLERLVLDPFLAVPDRDRRNNAWPPPNWPAAMAGASDGSVAIGLARAWNAADIARLLWRTPGGHEQVVPLPPGSAPPLGWDPAAQRLALSGEALAVWGRNTGLRTALRGPAGFLGWDPARWWAWDARRGRIAIDDAPAAGAPELPPGLVPAPGGLREGGGALAWITAQRGIAVFRPGADAAPGLAPLEAGIVDLAWSPADAAWTAVHDAGRILRWRDGTAPELLRALPYPVQRAQLAPGGARMAWWDPAGSLRYGAAAAGAPAHTASIGGTPVLAAWAGPALLYLIAAETHERLPMRMHAEYRVWRIDAETGRAQALGTIATAPSNGALYLRQRPAATP